ncbi:transmembrane and coiled-coil domain-containing protein 6-like [Gracilinanus agilis]|uniref:transmembrane and coiled-coil domain-containing protein 6-like n=1 Tax=Gracilinanus agilis TaxID=191870 RepID=UPI001CFDF803|nr:transmembrane and coiled-coil domain-containing protein 6-like [Gracilinanus agilis]
MSQYQKQQIQAHWEYQENKQSPSSQPDLALQLFYSLRKARREQHLVSKRLLRDSDLEEARDEFPNRPLEELEVLHLLRMSQRGTEKEKEKALISLRHSLQHPETQQTFIRLEGSIRTLIGLLTSNWASLQMEAARCLHELSHADQPNVAEACLPSTSYLLTYLSGHSADFIVRHLVMEFGSKGLVPDSCLSIHCSDA